MSDGDRPVAWSAAATREVQLLVDDFMDNLNYNASDIIKYSNSDTFTKKLAVAATKALCAGPLATRARAPNALTRARAVCRFDGGKGATGQRGPDYWHDRCVETERAIVLTAQKLGLPLLVLRAIDPHPTSPSPSPSPSPSS